MKKQFKLIILLFVIIGLYAVINLLPKNYTYKYSIEDYKIVEKYDKKKKIYYFEVANEDDIYEYNIKSKYYTSRGLLKKVSIIDDCLNAESKKLDSFSICKKDDKYYTKYYDKKIDAEKKDTYEKIDIYNLLDKSFLIWNYNNFVGINSSKKEIIDLFDGDFYNLDVVMEYDSSLVIADYNSKYTFEKLYFIDSKNFKYDELKLDRKIYFNSYFLGSYKKDLYLYDLQKKQEYKIDTKEKRVYKIKPMVLHNNEFESVSENKLNKKEVFFTSDNDYYFYLDNNKLMYNKDNIKINVSNIEVSKIIKANEEEVYFLSGDSLYYIDINKGGVKMLSYNEWNFNNSNIYIFD